jgi:hypothetical protein
MTISRQWATPLVIGAFAIMSVTGTLMFFHLNSVLSKPVHEWAGLVLVAGVILHVVVNWRAFKSYFSGLLGLAIIGLGVVILALSFLPLGGAKGGGGPSAPVLAMNAIAKASISNVAALTGRPVAQVMEDLSKAGISLPSAEASIDSATRGDRALQGKAMAVLFRKSKDGIAPGSTP